MSQDVKESLSAVMDGEASEFELHRALKNASDADVATWSRYQVASSVMKKDNDLFLGSDISAAVAAAIAEEPPLAQAASPKRRSVISFAAAAAITVAVFAGLQVQVASNNDSATTADVAVVAPAPTESAPVFAGGQGLSLQAEQGFATVSGNLQLEPNTTQRAVADSIAADRLNTYIEAHTANSSVNTNEGIIPFARVESAKE